MSQTILDSNVWIAFLNKNDSQNTKAIEIFANISIAEVLLTEYIVLEVATIIKQKKGHYAAIAFLNKFLHVAKLAMINSTEFYQETVNSFVNMIDNKLSFVDTSLVVLSEKYKIITFDKELARTIAANKN